VERRGDDSHLWRFVRLDCLHNAFVRVPNVPSSSHFLSGTLVGRVIVARQCRARPILFAASVWRWIPGRRRKGSPPSRPIGSVSWQGTALLVFSRIDGPHVAPRGTPLAKVAGASL
jgi:hypothetical protein